MNPDISNRIRIEQESRSRRRSAWVTIGIAAALVVGTPVLISQCSNDDEEDPVVEGHAYANNHYIPGAGYYHSGYHGFFPYRHNFFDSSRGGYFHGGAWSATPEPVSNLTPSVPTRSAATAANSQYRAAHPSTRGGFGRTGSFFSGRS
jgi:hypothetical protein